MERKQVLLTLGAAGVGAWLLWRRYQEPGYSLAGKTVLITGGSRGLGLALAREAAGRGARVAVCARDPEELQRAADDLAGYGPPPLALPCDVTDPGRLGERVRDVEAHFGPVDVLINNAGIIEVGPEATMTRADFDRALEVNFWGAFNATQAVLPSMRARRQGRIVNISSIGGKLSVPHLLPYSVSKFALVGYSQGLRAELAPEGIVVTTVCPGLMRTGSPRQAHFKGQHRREYAWFAISDSLPGLTVSAEQAAREIVEGCCRGDAEVVISLPAKLAVTLQALFPEWTADLLALANRLLPGPGGIGTASRTGAESESALTRSPLTALTRRAEERNNELGPAES